MATGRIASLLSVACLFWLAAGQFAVALDVQTLINQTKWGDIVTIPPGVYRQGLFIGKSLTVRLHHVQLLGVAKRKGIINVKCDRCRVVLEDFHGNGRKSGCLRGNCSGIKVEGVDFHLTVKRAHIDNTVMGILTDNRGGRLVVEDSLIENTGLNDHSRGLGHGLYAGRIDTLILRRSTIRNVNSAGHILKSRAQETILANARLLGARGFHSRSIDLPCGGSLEVKNSTIQHGENSENLDVIALGTEPQNCAILAGEVSITKSWIILDRRKNGKPNILFRWRAPMANLTIKNNYFVNLGRWSSAASKDGDIEIGDFGAQNKICFDRAACGLTRGQIPLSEEMLR